MHDNGSIELDPQYWNFELSGHGLAILGMEVSKIGRSTGWTTGTVAATCLLYVPGGQMGLRCQDVVTGEVNPGDSGAPVIMPSLVEGTASLFGIVHTKIKLEGQWHYIYSPIFGVLNDLGMFYTFEGGSLPG